MTTTTTTTTLMATIIKETVMVGIGNNTLVNVEYASNGYSSNGTSVVYTKDMGSPIVGIVCGQDTNKAYISTANNLYSYNVSYYVGSNEIEKILSVTNTDGSIISTYRKGDNSLWAIQSYQGKIAKMDPSDLSIVKTYEEFDAPYKIRYSAYHNAYFVAGSHILWKIDSSDVVSAAYEINGYSLKDFDVSESGVICMLFRGTTEDIIRIVSGDLYSIVLDKRLDRGTLAFCRYCNAGRFYVLVELNTGSSVYSASHYVFNSTTNELDIRSLEESIFVTTTTTTPGTTSKAVQVVNPSGGVKIQKGKQYDIQWMSSKGVGDFVKIELYKANVLYGVLSDKTANTGIFSWNVASDIEDGEDYKVKITWLVANTDPNNYDYSASAFSILTAVATTTTTTTTKMTQHAIGVDYSPASDQVLIVLASGLYAIFMLPTLTSEGLLDLGVTNPSTFATRSMVINGESKQSRVRVFVGSQKYWSDKWDSGIVETELKSMYYGGGNNLQPGQKYFVHIQTYSDKYGWGELQISEFVMPK